MQMCNFQKKILSDRASEQVRNGNEFFKVSNRHFLAFLKLGACKEFLIFLCLHESTMIILGHGGHAF